MKMLTNKKSTYLWQHCRTISNVSQHKKGHLLNFLLSIADLCIAKSLGRRAGGDSVVYCRNLPKTLGPEKRPGCPNPHIEPSFMGLDEKGGGEIMGAKKCSYRGWVLLAPTNVLALTSAHNVQKTQPKPNNWTGSK